MIPHALKCEHQRKPINIDTPTPRLAWQSWAVERGITQVAYQIRVARAVNALESPGTCVWDSRRVNSSQPWAVYTGNPLRSEARYFWKVRLWDNHDRCGPWSEAAPFESALLRDQDWRDAQWIARRDSASWQRDWDVRKAQELERAPNTREFKFPLSVCDQLDPWELAELTNPPYDPAPLFQKEFTTRYGIRSARLYISGLGYYVAQINGQRVGDQVLDPGWTNYHRTALYSVHDIKDLLTTGKNNINVLLGRGFYGQLASDIWGFHNSPWLGQPTLRAKLVVTYTHGTALVVVTDASWLGTDSHILLDDPRLGELHDLRLKSEDWVPVHVVSGPTGKLNAQQIPPIRAVKYRKPVAVEQINDTTKRYDFGENFSGWAEITVEGNTGDRILTRYAEQPQGDDLSDKVLNGYQQAGFVLGGEGEQALAPDFSYKAFRYLQVNAPAQTLANATVTGAYVHTDIETFGHFSCSNPMLNRLDAMWRLTQRNNMHSIPTDCPHREKLGWMADAFIAQKAAMYSFDMTAFYEKYTQDVADTHNPAGLLSVIAPAGEYSQGVSAVWSSALILIPWQLYQFTGDASLLRKHFRAMVRLIRATDMQQQVPGKAHIITEQFGDWANPEGNIPPEGTHAYGTAYHYQNCRIVAQIARLLGDEATAIELDMLGDMTRNAFNTHFFNAEMNTYHGDKATDYRQSVNAIALNFGLAPQEVQRDVFAHLCEDIESRDNNHDCGLIGLPALLDVLHDYGRPDLAYKIINQRSSPSWGYMLEQGATTMWETWNGEASHNHPMYGCVVDYFYRRLAGIEPVTPGFDRFNIAPEFENDIIEVNAETMTVHGQIKVRWQRHAQTLTLNLSIPVNMHANLRLPWANITRSVTEGESIIWDNGEFTALRGILDAKANADGLWLTLGSGEYNIRAHI